MSKTKNPIDTELQEAEEEFGGINLDEVLRRNPKNLSTADLETIVKRQRRERASWIEKTGKKKGKR